MNFTEKQDALVRELYEQGVPHWVYHKESIKRFGVGLSLFCTRKIINRLGLPKRDSTVAKRMALIWRNNKENKVKYGF